MEWDGWIDGPYSPSPVRHPAQSIHVKQRIHGRLFSYNTTSQQHNTTGDEVRVCISGLSDPRPGEDLVAAFAPATAPFNATAPIKVGRRT